MVQSLCCCCCCCLKRLQIKKKKQNYLKYFKHWNKIQTTAIPGMVQSLTDWNHWNWQMSTFKYLSILIQMRKSGCQFDTSWNQATQHTGFAILAKSSLRTQLVTCFLVWRLKKDHIIVVVVFEKDNKTPS